MYCINILFLPGPRSWGPGSWGPGCWDPGSGVLRKTFPKTFFEKNIFQKTFFEKNEKCINIPFCYTFFIFYFFIYRRYLPGCRGAAKKISNRLENFSTAHRRTATKRQCRGPCRPSTTPRCIIRTIFAITINFQKYVNLATLTWKRYINHPLRLFSKNGILVPKKGLIFEVLLPPWGG